MVDAEILQGRAYVAVAENPRYLLNLDTRSCIGLPSLSTGIKTTTEVMDLEILGYAMRVGFLCRF